MFVKVAFLVVFTLLQVNENVSQQPNSSPMWNPYSWMTPYASASGVGDSLGSYVKMAQDWGNKFYKQLDKSGVLDVFNVGMGLASQSSDQAQVATEQAMLEAMKKGQSSSMNKSVVN